MTDEMKSLNFKVVIDQNQIFEIQSSTIDYDG
jgi:hypothetical protein